jgi:hypothetical protein
MRTPSPGGSRSDPRRPTTWTVDESVASHRRDTPQIGLWIDSSTQTPAETTDEILRRLDEARVA